MQNYIQINPDRMEKFWNKKTKVLTFKNVDVMSETEKCYQIDFGNQYKSFWIPKSKVKSFKIKKDGTNTFIVESWIIRKLVSEKNHWWIINFADNIQGEEE